MFKNRIEAYSHCVTVVSELICETYLGTSPEGPESQSICGISTADHEWPNAA